MFRAIAIVTLVVQHLAGVETAYRDDLHYEAVDRGVITSETATVWDAPAMTGRDYVLMRPASGAEVHLRLVEAAPGTPPATALRTTGWNAAELLVTDPDALALQLDGSAFRMIGPPRNLAAGENPTRAMQVLGPEGEALYLTRFVPGTSGLDLGRAATPVDRVFIVVVGGRDLDALRAFYRDALGLPLTEYGQWPIGVLAAAWCLPAGTRFALAGAALPRDFMVELDDYPDQTLPRRRAPGALPIGWAMVTFTAPELDDLAVNWRSPPRPLAGQPYRGRMTGVTVGPAGEWIEVIEAPVAR